MQILIFLTYPILPKNEAEIVMLQISPTIIGMRRGRIKGEVQGGQNGTIVFLGLLTFWNKEKKKYEKKKDRRRNRIM